MPCGASLSLWKKQDADVTEMLLTFIQDSFR
jgi:hypothetical protein